MMPFQELIISQLIIYGEFFREIQFGLMEYGCDFLILHRLKTDFSPPLYPPLAKGGLGGVMENPESELCGTAFLPLIFVMSVWIVWHIWTTDCRENL